MKRQRLVLTGNARRIGRLRRSGCRPWAYVVLELRDMAWARTRSPLKALDEGSPG